MKTNGTYNELAHFRNDIGAQSKAHPTFAAFHRNKIADFFKYNAMRLQLLDEKIDALFKQFIEHDGEGKRITYTDENGKELFKYYSEEAKNRFTEKYAQLMNTNITIEY